MDLSANMPAKMDSQMDARMPATMKSDAPAYPGEGGSDDAPVVNIVQKSSGGVECDAVNRKGEAIGTADVGTKGWELTDRKNTETGGYPQRDPDNDGDLN